MDGLVWVDPNPRMGQEFGSLDFCQPVWGKITVSAHGRGTPNKSISLGFPENMIDGFSFEEISLVCSTFMQIFHVELSK